MTKTIDIKHLMATFKLVFDDVCTNKHHYIITENGEEKAALIPYEEYEKYLATDKET